MLAADTLIATLVEKYARIVAVVDDSITHKHHTMFPTATCNILLGIASRHCLNESNPIAALHILLPWSDMHPPDKIASRLNEQGIAVVAHPCRHAHAHVWPFIACSLSIAVHHDNTVIEPYLTLAKAGLAEACACNDLIGNTAVSLLQACLHIVEIAIAPAPEVGIGKKATGLDNACLSRLQCLLSATERSDSTSIGIYNIATEDKAASRGILIAHLSLDIYCHLAVGDVVIATIYICSRSLKIAV